MGALFDLSSEFAFLSGQLLHAPGDGSEGEQCAGELGVVVGCGSGLGEAGEQPGAGEPTQLAAERLGCCDQQVTELAEPGSSGVDGAFAGGLKRPQRLAFAVAARDSWTLPAQHAASGTDRVERVGLAARASLPGVGGRPRTPARRGR